MQRRLCLPCQIQHAAVVCDPRVAFVFLAFLIVQVAAVDFTQVRLQCPDKIADQVGVRLGKLHRIRQHGMAGFGTQQYTFRVEFVQHLIPILIVVIPGNIQIRVKVFCGIFIHADVGFRVSLPFLVVRQIVDCAAEDGRIVHPIRLLPFRVIAHPFVLIGCQIRRTVQIFPQPMYAGA